MTSGPQTRSDGTPEAVDARPEADDAPSPGPSPGDVPVPPSDEAADDAADVAGADGGDPGSESGGPVDADADAGAGAGADTEGTGEAPEPTLEERLAAAEALAAEHWNSRLRLQADLENQRKRALRDVQNARKFGLEPLLNDLLPVVDSIEMGLQASAADNVTVASIREGNEMTQKMLAGALGKHGIAEVNPVGEKFDPEFHQAMSMQEVEGAAPNTVVQVLQKGYTLNERLMRPALVMVAK